MHNFIFTSDLLKGISHYSYKLVCISTPLNNVNLIFIMCLFSFINSKPAKITGKVVVSTLAPTQLNYQICFGVKSIAGSPIQVKSRYGQVVLTWCGVACRVVYYADYYRG